MTLAGPPDPVLAAWHRRFPDRRHLWTGTIRLCHVELPVREPESPSLLARWAAQAAALGGDAARRLGLPEAVVAAVGGRPVRRGFAFLDLPGGPVPVPVPPMALPGTPEAVAADEIPAAVLRPPGVDVVPRSADWRTVPVVRAERLAVVAVRRGDGIEVYVADVAWQIGESPTWRLPAGAIPAAAPEAWAAAWQEWCRGKGIDSAPEVVVERGMARVSASSADGWLWAGGGPLREGAVIVGTGL